MYFDESTAEGDLLVLLSALEYESIREPSNTYVSARLYDRVILAYIFIRSIATQVSSAFFSTRVNEHLNLDVLWVRKVDIVTIRRVESVKIGSPLLIIIKVSTKQIQVLILV